MTENNESNPLLNEGKIRIFKTKDATSDNKRPQYWGKTTIEGKEYKIALWIQTAKESGNKYFGGTIQDANKPEEVADEPTPETTSTDDLPF